MAVFGIVVMFWWAAIHAKSEVRDYCPWFHRHLAAVVALWSICNTEVWKRTERTCVGVGHGRRGEGAAAAPVQGFADMRPGLGPGAFYPPYKRRRHALRRRGDVPLHRRQPIFIDMLWMKTEEGMELYFGLKGRV